MVKPGIDYARLAEALARDRKVLEYPRVQHVRCVRRYLGPRYSEETAHDPSQPVNLIGTYVAIMGRSLIAQNPRVLLSAADRSQRATVQAMQDWANSEIDGLGLEDTLSRWVLDALFSLGILYVGLANPMEAALALWPLSAGKVLAKNVHLDDFCYDTHAHDFREADYLAHRWRGPLAAAKSFLGRKAKNLQESSDPRYNREGDERLGVLGRGPYGGYSANEVEPKADLWQVYHPRHRWISIHAADDLGGDGDPQPLWEQPFIGPESGPYHFLGFGTAPGNAMPKAPVPDLMDLNDAVNNITRKLINQADRQKEVVFVQGAADADGNRLLSAPDGAMIRVDDPKAIVPTKWGGPNQENFLLGESLRTLFSWLAGNLDMMGGLSPQSKTLGQDRMLEENASRGVADMQKRTINGTARVLKALCWHWWKNPKEVMKTTHSLPGHPDMTVQRHIYPDRDEYAGQPFVRRGAFEDLKISVDPYSLRSKSPEERMAALSQLMQTVVLPLAPLLAQQNLTPDLKALLQKYAGWMDMPDLQDIVTVGAPPEQGAASAPDGPGMAPQTERTYIRKNMPGRTQEGDSMMMRNQMIGLDTGGAQRNGQPAGVGGKP